MFDAEHQAFYGKSVRTSLMSPNFRPSAVYIGTSGIEFDDRAGILLGYHAGDPEKDVKMALFQCPAKARVILATPRKISNAGGRVFDVLSVPELDVRAPIYLVTTEPEPKTTEEKLFNQALKVFKSKKIQNAIRDKGIKFHWIIVDRKSADVPKAVEHIIAPIKLKSSIASEENGLVTTA